MFERKSFKRSFLENVLGFLAGFLHFIPGDDENTIFKKPLSFECKLARTGGCASGLWGSDFSGSHRGTQD